MCYVSKWKRDFLNTFEPFFCALGVLVVTWLTSNDDVINQSKRLTLHIASENDCKISRPSKNWVQGGYSSLGPDLYSTVSKKQKLIFLTPVFFVSFEVQSRTRPLICVWYSVHYWVSCAINKEDFFWDCICRRCRHTFASLWGACLRFSSLWRTNSRGDSCVLDVHHSSVCWGLLFCLRKAFIF